MSLKEIRMKKGLTQQEVAAAIGCSSVVYSRYETEARQPSIEALLRMADVMGVTVDCLLGRQEIEDSTLSAYEIELVNASRDADSRAREDAMVPLKVHCTSSDKKGSIE